MSSYPGSRKLAAVEAPEEIATAARADESEIEALMRRSADRAYTKGVKRGEICAFIEGHADRVLQTDVTVQSILEFVPGVRVAVAAEQDSLAAYERFVPSLLSSSSSCLLCLLDCAKNGCRLNDLLVATVFCACGVVQKTSVVLELY